MLSINPEDVKKVLIQIAPYLIAIAVVLVLGVIVIAACKNMASAKKYMVRRQAGLAMVLVTVIVINLICFGPMSTLISLATGSGSIDEATSAEASQLVEEIAREGIVLLKNDGGMLPLDKGSGINVFGWASSPAASSITSGVASSATSTRVTSPAGSPTSRPLLSQSSWVPKGAMASTARATSATVVMAFPSVLYR